AFYLSSLNCSDAVGFLTTVIIIVTISCYLLAVYADKCIAFRLSDSLQLSETQSHQVIAL
ncbi:MAG: hypothetical protein ACRC49_07105, partial [Plesiomonas sp.]